MKLRFREKNLLVVAVVGIVAMLAVLFGSFQIAALPIIAGTSYEAAFVDGGGLKSGDEVDVAGTQVGKVTDVSIDGTDALVTFTAKHVVLGQSTTAVIETQTLLGERRLKIVPSGPGEMQSGDKIPVQRTQAPYSITQAIEDLTNKTSQIDNQSVSKALDTFSQTFKNTPNDIEPAFVGLSRLSQTVSSRDAELQQLLARAESVTGLLRDHTAQVTDIIQQGNLLLGELEQRRQVIHDLLVQTTQAADQASGFVNEQNGKLKPALDQLNQAMVLLHQNEGNTVAALQRISSFITGLGEGLSTTPQFSGVGDLAGASGTATPVQFVPQQFFTEPTLPTAANPSAAITSLLPQGGNR
ncbi:MCE family protein [Actinomycetospora sp. TBRC 11914]|uniref:MCE family protein n=1 Tax=Actinomycetospora sp. TBRC 11914 TaxID=2729387 RepID=UPI00145DB1BE|nr:MCE family protein [Actinomycetospora sp. TBRC 11914]NMO91620.1 MCE family protein [Actinomycetospora sp. TBRC 11914]